MELLVSHLIYFFHFLCVNNMPSCSKMNMSMVNTEFLLQRYIFWSNAAFLIISIKDSTYLNVPLCQKKKPSKEHRIVTLRRQELAKVACPDYHPLIRVRSDASDWHPMVLSDKITLTVKRMCIHDHLRIKSFWCHSFLKILRASETPNLEFLFHFRLFLCDGNREIMLRKNIKYLYNQ